MIHCPEFNFEFLNTIILKQSSEINRLPSVSSTKKSIQINKRMSEKYPLHKFSGKDVLISLGQNR